MCLSKSDICDVHVMNEMLLFKTFRAASKLHVKTPQPSIQHNTARRWNNTRQTWENKLKEKLCFKKRGKKKEMQILGSGKSENRKG